MSLKPRLGDIATPGRVCSPHNEIYDCRLRPNGIGCLRRGGGSGAGRLPDRPDRSRHSGPIRHPNATIFRSATLGFRSGRTESPRRAAFRLCCRKTREKREGERRSPSGRRIRPETYHAPGRQNRKCGRGESGASASSGARKARATGLRVAQDRSFPTETPDEPGISVKPDYTLCYTSRSRRCFRLILPDGWKPSGMEPAGKCLHLAHSVY